MNLKATMIQWLSIGKMQMLVLLVMSLKVLVLWGLEWMKRFLCLSWSLK
jgi:hypothetical protein